MGENINWELFTNEDHTIAGNVRAIVEDNRDPTGGGRVRVRIIGLHSPFSIETPVEDLPWAEPALAIGWSGGHNMKNPDYSNDKTRYITSGSEAAIPNKLVIEQTPKTGSFIDPIENDCGTGGVFTVPRKGTIVWVFFENGDHTRCTYFAASPKLLDWKEQTSKIVQDVNDKRDVMSELRTEFIPDKTSHTGIGPSAGAQVNTFCSIPRVNMFPIDDINVEDITSITSKQGTTIVIVNQKGRERIYIMNKGTGTSIDEWGHKKEIVGITKSEGQTINCNEEKIVAGNSELHVVGDYDLYSKGNIFIQGDSNIQVNGKNNVGIVVREGDADIIVEKGNVNVDSKSANVNVHGGQNVQVQADKDVIVKAGGNISAKATGIAEIQATEIKLNATTKLSLEAQTISIKSDTSISMQANTTLDVQAGSQFQIGPNGFGGNVAVNAPVSNAFHTGCFPGPGAGPAVSVTALINPTSPYVDIPFIVLTKPLPVDTTKQEKSNSTDTPLTPEKSGNPV